MFHKLKNIKTSVKYKIISGLEKTQVLLKKPAGRC
jgi:hypothetical protein